MSEQPIVHTERVDDVPLLLAHMQRLGLPSILDTHLSSDARFLTLVTIRTFPRGWSGCGYAWPLCQDHMTAHYRKRV